MRRKVGLVALAAAAAAGGVASAEVIVGLTTSQQLVTFDSANPGVILNTSPVISGLSAGDSIVDIDYYPVNGLLHGMGTSGNLYRISPVTGAATLDVTPQSSLGTPQDMDFNPAVDRLRVFSAADLNYRLTPSVGTAGSNGANAGLVSNDGTLMYVGGSPDPDLVGAAYSNNFDGTATTTLYSIDTGNDSLVVHSVGPQFSTLTAVGPLGVPVGRSVGFDISASGTAFVSDGNGLYTISLGTGAMGYIGAIGGPLSVTTIAAATVPEPAGAALLAAAAVLAIRRR